MPDIDKQTPMQMAANLHQKYDARAIFQASIEAYVAIEKKDIYACLFWNEVLKILDTEM